MSFEGSQPPQQKDPGLNVSVASDVDSAPCHDLARLAPLWPETVRGDRSSCDLCPRSPCESSTRSHPRPPRSTPSRGSAAFRKIPSLPRPAHHPLPPRRGGTGLPLGSGIFPDKHTHQTQSFRFVMLLDGSPWTSVHSSLPVDGRVALHAPDTPLGFAAPATEGHTAVPGFSAPRSSLWTLWSLGRAAVWPEGWAVHHRPRAGSKWHRRLNS